MFLRALARVAGTAGLLVAAVACSRAPAPATAPIPGRPVSTPRTGLEVIGAMRWAHPSRELQSLAFTVTTVEYGDGDSTITRARVHAQLPGHLRVETLPTSSRTAYIRQYHRFALFEGGRRVTSASRMDLASLLAYDVFAQRIDTTVMWLDASRMRIALLRREALDGRPVWVVGASSGDFTSTQFWVDADRWRVLRVIQPDPRAPTRLEDVHFTHDTTLLDVPVPTRVLVYRGGRLAQRQTLSNFKTNPRVPARAFDLRRWRDVGTRN
ncbi:MAG: hypothetical protein WD801_13060 [Gemmatimonadaceae bacterium]